MRVRPGELVADCQHALLKRAAGVRDELTRVTCPAIDHYLEKKTSRTSWSSGSRTHLRAHLEPALRRSRQVTAGEELGIEGRGR